MSCSICGSLGHNARTCSKKMKISKSDETHVLWVKFDNITEEQSNELLKAMIDIKSSVAPNARGTFARGTKNEMPQKIAEALRINQDDSDNEPKKIKQSP